MAVFVVSEKDDKVKPPVVVKIEQEGDAVDICFNGELVATMLHNNLSLMFCSGVYGVRKDHPELFTKNGYLRVSEEDDDVMN